MATATTNRALQLRVFVIFVALSAYAGVVVVVSGEPLAESVNFTQLTAEKKHGCAMRGICGRDGELNKNCRYEGVSVPLTQSDVSRYRDLCPRIFDECKFFASFILLQREKKTAIFSDESKTLDEQIHEEYSLLLRC